MESEFGTRTNNDGIVLNEIVVHTADRVLIAQADCVDAIRFTRGPYK